MPDDVNFKQSMIKQKKKKFKIKIIRFYSTAQKINKVTSRLVADILYIVDHQECNPDLTISHIRDIWTIFNRISMLYLALNVVSSSICALWTA